MSKKSNDIEYIHTKRETFVCKVCFKKNTLMANIKIHLLNPANFKKYIDLRINSILLCACS